jgi:hypothetical protein
MKKILAALALSLVLPAATCRAGDFCCSGGHCGSISYGFRFKICGCLKWSPCGPCCGGGSAPCCFGGDGGGGGGAGPWYSYWPLEAHFQVPAPTGYPYWPNPMDSNVVPQQLQHYGYAGPGVYVAPQPAPATPGVHQPVGYFQQAPSYWYGN